MSVKCHQYLSVLVSVIKESVKGYPCTPCIVGTWKDVYDSEKILRNNADATSEGDKLSALTQRSFLVCAYGGLIEPISSGQEEE